MNELERLQYLEALDITQWVSREALPFAKATQTVELETLLPEGFADNSDHERSGSHSQAQAESQSQALSQSQAPVQSKTEKPRRKIVLEKPAHTPQGSHSEDPAQTSNVPHSSSDENSSARENQSSSENPSVSQSQSSAPQQQVDAVNFAFQVQGRRAQYLVLAELQDSSGRINPEEQTLLTNIIKAIDALYADSSTTLIHPEHFKWPMFQAHPNAKFINPGKEAAQQSASAFVASHIKRNLSKTIIILGDSLAEHLNLAEHPNHAEHLHSEPAYPETASPEQAQQEKNFEGAKIILGASLSALLSQSPHLKAQLWQKLQSGIA